MTRNILRTLALAIAAIATLTAGTVQAQSSSYEWSEESSWQSSWQSGPDGYHETFDEQYRENSTETHHNGFNTETIENGYERNNGYEFGNDRHGTYDNDYNHESGYNNYDNTYDNGMYRDQFGTQDSWERNQGTNRNWNNDGSYDEHGYNDYRDQYNEQQTTGYYDAYGRWVESGTTFERETQDLYDYSEQFDRYGNRTFNQNGFQDQRERRGGFNRG